MDFRHAPGPQDSPLVLLARVGGVGPDRTAGVGGIDQAGQFSAIVPGGIAGRTGADEAVAPVDAAMRFVAEHGRGDLAHDLTIRSEEHTSALQSLMLLSSAVFCLKQNIKTMSNH